MSFWKKLLGGENSHGRIDYYAEGMELLSVGKFHEAPGDPVVLQQIAVAYTRIGMTDEAAKTYRHVLQKSPNASGAHYGLAFLMIRAGQAKGAVPHLKSFLAHPPSGPDAAQHVEHAQSTLAQLTGQSDDVQRDPETP